MTTEESLRLALMIGGPISSLVGIGIAAGVTASPYVNVGAKALGWPLSIFAGLWCGAALGEALLPGWGGFATALLFGHGFLSAWAVAATLGHDDTAHNAGRFMRWAWPLIGKIRRKLRGGAKKPRLRVPPVGETSRNEARKHK